MSNENIENVASNDASVSQVQEPVNTEVSQEPVKEYSEVERKAIEMGWDPNHQGKTFVDAAEYVNRRPLFERIEKQNQQILELKNLFKQTTDHLSSVRKESYEAALKDLEAKKLQAVTDGDVERFKLMEAEAKNVQNKMASDPITHIEPAKPEIDPELENWSKTNSSWYNSESVENRKMVAAADAIDTFLTNQARIDQGIQDGSLPKINVKEHLKAVEREVERLFPHRFKNMNREQPAAVGKSTAGNVTKTNTGLAARLTPEQRQLAEAFHKSNPKYTPEHYAADLDKMGRLAK